MSGLQEQAIQMISSLSDDKLLFLMEIIKKLMPQKPSDSIVKSSYNEEGIQAFHRLEEARAEIHQYLPEDFDLDKELGEARAEHHLKLLKNVLSESLQAI